MLMKGHMEMILYTIDFGFPPAIGWVFIFEMHPRCILT